MTTVVKSISNTPTFSANSPTPKIGKDVTEDRFLKLLIAQMKNQDPLNPLDNAQVTSQMAQINTVQGISQLNTTMGAMLAQFQGAQAISLSGRQVLVEGNSLNLTKADDALGSKGGYALSADADRVTVDIKDDKGNVVKQLTLGAQKAGTNTFNWTGALENGLAAQGKYTFDVKAYQGTTLVPVTALQSAKVEGSTITSQGVRLMLEGLGARYYGDVYMVL